MRALNRGRKTHDADHEPLLYAQRFSDFPLEYVGTAFPALPITGRGPALVKASIMKGTRGLSAFARRAPASVILTPWEPGSLSRSAPNFLDVKWFNRFERSIEHSLRPGDPELGSGRDQSSDKRLVGLHDLRLARWPVFSSRSLSRPAQLSLAQTPGDRTPTKLAR